MKTTSILMSTPMCRALDLGLKTQTRRMVDPQPRATEYLRWRSGRIAYVFAHNHLEFAVAKCRYGDEGDYLYVKEAWEVAAWRPGCVDIRYVATGDVLTVASVGDKTLAAFIKKLGEDEKLWFAKGVKARDPFRRRS